LKNLDFNKEIFNFFSPEIKNEFKGDISFMEINWDKENIIEDKKYWKNLLNKDEKTLIFTGNLNFKRELRKALLEETQHPTAIEERKLASRLFFILNLNLYFIDATSGEVVYKKNFKESKGYKNINQKSTYALFELFEEIKTKLFREIITHKKKEERYLILN
jgi:hypothetical protein